VDAGSRSLRDVEVALEDAGQAYLEPSALSELTSTTGVPNFITSRSTICFIGRPSVGARGFGFPLLSLG
jgi:hypothetical protein